MAVNNAMVEEGGAVKLRVIRGTAAELTSANPTLATGEPAVETDTGYFKIGDGSTAWTSLTYATSKVPGYLTHTGTRVGFFNTTPVVKATVTGSRGSNAALASLLTALAGYGLLTDSSS